MRARAFVCLLLILSLIGFPAGAKTPPKKKNLQAGGTDFLIDMGLSLVKSVAGAALNHALFPQKTIDVQKLLADMTAAMRQELIKNVLDNDEASLTAATTALHDYEAEWTKSGDGVEYERRVSNDSTINAVNLVFARTGPTGKKEYAYPGLRLFVTAAQIKANRLQLRRRMLNKPESQDAILPSLIEHLELSLKYVRDTLQARRVDTIVGRMAAITECNVYDHRRHWDNVTYYTRCHDYADQKCGQQAENDDSIALARCDGQRDRYMDSVRRAKAEEIDKEWLDTMVVLDAWATALDTLKKTPPAETARAARMDFGGMFGIGEKAFNNPLTGTTNCPDGFKAYEIKGTYNVDWPVYYCGRIGGPLEPIADFGGMAGQTDDRNSTYWNVNPITKSDSCPAGFDKATVTSQQALFYCWRRHTAGSRSDYLFGGMYSDNGDKKNPITNAMLCPTGFMPALVHGTRASTNVPPTMRTIICWQKEPPPRP